MSWILTTVGHGERPPQREGADEVEDGARATRAFGLRAPVEDRRITRVGRVVKLVVKSKASTVPTAKHENDVRCVTSDSVPTTNRAQESQCSSSVHLVCRARHEDGLPAPITRGSEQNFRIPVNDITDVDDVQGGGRSRSETPAHGRTTIVLPPGRVQPRLVRRPVPRARGPADRPARPALVDRVHAMCFPPAGAPSTSATADGVMEVWHAAGLGNPWAKPAKSSIVPAASSSTSVAVRSPAAGRRRPRHKRPRRRNRSGNAQPGREPGRGRPAPRRRGRGRQRPPARTAFDRGRALVVVNADQFAGRRPQANCSQPATFSPGDAPLVTPISVSCRRMPSCGIRTCRRPGFGARGATTMIRSSRPTPYSPRRRAAGSRAPATGWPGVAPIHRCSTGTALRPGDRRNGRTGSRRPPSSSTPPRPGASPVPSAGRYSPRHR